MGIKYVLIVVILLIGATDQLVTGDLNSKSQDIKEQKVLLRKLQNLQQPKDETKPLTWNVMLADVLVNKIQIFSFNNAKKEEIIDKKPQDNVLTKVTSQILLIYKKLYDTFWIRNTPHIQAVATIDDAGMDSVADASVGTVKGDSPKEQIELIEPRYHGKQQCDNCNETDEVTERPNIKEKSSPNCPDGLVRDGNGDCVYSKFIMAIPYQCPIGYRRDKLGYCRIAM